MHHLHYSDMSSPICKSLPDDSTDPTSPLTRANSDLSLQGKAGAIASISSELSTIDSLPNYRLLFQPSDRHMNSQSSILWSQDPNHYKEVHHLFGSESASTDQSDRDLTIRDQELYIEECLLADPYLGAGEQANHVISETMRASGGGSGTTRSAAGKTGAVTGGRLSMSSKWDDADRWIMKQLPSTPSSSSSSGGGHCTVPHYSPQKMISTPRASTDTFAVPPPPPPTASNNGTRFSVLSKGTDGDLAAHAARKLWLASAADKNPQIAWDATRISCGARSPQPQPQPQLHHPVAAARRSMKEAGTDTEPLMMMNLGSPCNGPPSSSQIFPGSRGEGCSGLSSPPRHNTPTRRSSSVSARSSMAAEDGPPRVELRDCHLAKLRLARERPLSGPLCGAAEDPGSSRITITYDKWPPGIDEPSHQRRLRLRPDTFTHLNSTDPHLDHIHNAGVANHRAPLITANHSVLNPWPPHCPAFPPAAPELSHNYLSNPYAHDDDYFRRLPQFKYDYRGRNGGTLDLVEARASAWEDVELAKYTAKFKREEAKIEAWESLQRAEAEAELKKLEVKLEKLRFGLREKILGRLWAAEKRAEEMRAAAQGHRAHVLARVSARASHIRQNRQLPGFINVCFTKKPSRGLSPKEL